MILKIGKYDQETNIKQYIMKTSVFLNLCKSSILMSLAAVITLASCNLSESRIIWLDELDITKVDQAAGSARVNQSMWRTPLSIALDTFERGVGTHAMSLMRVALDGKTKSFSALVGIDDSPQEHERQKASAEFLVYADNVEIWRSGVMRAGDKARPVEVNLKGIKELKLYVDHAGDGIVGDRANWVDAYFKVTGVTPYTTLREAESDYILTPDEPKVPVINPPYLHGIGKGNPVLITLPVSGERPMKFHAIGLPNGLILDAGTGRITGKCSDEGTYTTTVTVQNTHGIAKKSITLVVGDKLALTPPMGWNSWNVYGDQISQEKVIKTADAMVSSGLINYGYTYINIDDGWQGERGGKYNAIMPNEKFPDMKGMIDYIHSLGLKVGIYSTPWVWAYAGYTGGSADTPDGKIIAKERRHGKYSFHQQDVKQWVEWGFDYLKYDWNPNDVESTRIMSETLKTSGRDIVYSISNAAPFESAHELSALTNLWRTTGDIKDSWQSLITIGFMQDPWREYARPGHWNDPDMLVVGYVGWGNPRKSKLTPNEQYTHISLWSILAAPLLIGSDLTQLDEFTLNLLKNKEVLEINQDPAGIQGYRVKSDNKRKIEIWARPLHDGSLAVGLFNLNEMEQDISITLKELQIEGEHQIRDVWQQKDHETTDASYAEKVPPHGVKLVKFIPLRQETI
jgi:alpha-galactosidase